VASLGVAWRSIPPTFLADLRDLVGPRNLLTDPDLTIGHRIDWTGRFTADPVPVVRPGSAGEIAELVTLARRDGIALVPQGGNTGLVGGATPMEGGVVVDMRRLGQVSDLDPVAGQLTAGAGATIGEVQAVARGVGWEYGVDWAARDSATVGGSIATDAGGIRFVAHGGTRRQLIGIEAVFGSGELVSHLPRVEKDNTGYQLASLLCGSEGTLGLVTAARLRLVRPPGPTVVALLGFSSVADVVSGGTMLRLGSRPLALELMTARGLELVCRHLGLTHPFEDRQEYVLLAELEDHGNTVQAVLAEMEGLTASAVALDAASQLRLWRYREGHTEAISRLGSVHKLDVTLPPGVLADFIAEIPAAVAALRPKATVWLFGHVGDGNIHVNLTGLDPDDDDIDGLVLTEVAARGGSISAEHGIGRAKRRFLSLAHGAADLAVMERLRAALDPDRICNPGVLLP